MSAARTTGSSGPGSARRSVPHQVGVDADVRVVRWLDGAEDEVWRLLLSVHGQLLARLDDELKAAHGLNLADFEVLVALSEGDGALRMSDLAGRVYISPSGLTRRVDRLVGRGLVARRACPSDGRGSLAELTETGREELEAAAPTHVGGVRRYLLDPLPRDGMASLAAGLRDVERAVTAPGDADTPVPSR